MTTVHAPSQPASRPMRPSRHAKADPFALLGVSGEDPLDALGPETLPQDRKPLPAPPVDDIPF